MEFLEALDRQVLIFDGAMGTMVQGLDLSPADFGGEAYEMLADMLSFSRPDDLKEIHLEYFRAGANAVAVFVKLTVAFFVHKIQILLTVILIPLKPHFL